MPVRSAKAKDDALMTKQTGQGHKGVKPIIHAQDMTKKLVRLQRSTFGLASTAQKRYMFERRLVSSSIVVVQQLNRSSRD
jgi:hypothetical protein